MRILLLLAFVVASVLPAGAADRVALVIANSAYAVAPALPKAQASADLVANTLGQLGFSVTLVRDQSRAGLSDALAKFSAEGQGASAAVVYFAGYGLALNGENALLPVDTTLASASGDGVPLAQIIGGLPPTAAKIILLDTFWADLATGGARGLATVVPPESTFIAMAAAPGTVAVEGTGATTPFADAFAKLSVTPALSVNELGKKLRNDVMQATIGQQFPWFASTLADTVVLLPDGGVVAPEPAQELEPRPVAELPADPADDALWDMVKGGGSEALLRHYLQFYPNGRHAAEASAALGGAPLPTDNGELAAKPLPEPAPETEAPAEEVTKNGSGTIGAEPPTKTAPAPTADPSQENTVWEIARAFDNVDLYQDYLARYPNGTFAAEAQERIIALFSPPDEIASAVPPPDDQIVSGPPPGGFGGAPEPSTEAPGDGDSLGWLGGLIGEPVGSASSSDGDLGSSGGGGGGYLGSGSGEGGLAEEPMTSGSPDTSIGSALPGSAGSGDPETGIVGEPPDLAGETPPIVVEPAPVVTPPPPLAAAPIERFPTIDAPDKVLGGDTVTVSIALTEFKETPEVTAKAAPGGTVTAEGALQLVLPADQEEWDIDVDLFATGFDLADGSEFSRRITLYRGGDSDPARFKLTARSISGEPVPRQFKVRFYHEGEFLGSATRAVTIFPDAQALEVSNAPAMGVMSLAAAPAVDLSTDLLIGEAVSVPDMDVTIHYDDPDNLGAGLIIVHSPHIGAPVTSAFTTSAGMPDWLNSEYKHLVELGLDLRGATTLKKKKKSTQASQKRFLTKVAEGFGDDLYRNYVPDPFKEVFQNLRAQGKLHSIQITSNSPVLPWELVRPDAEAGGKAGFLGIDYRLARWAPRESGGQVDRPLNRMAFSGVATVAPAYDGANELPFQQVEVDALSKLAGFRMIDGDFSSFEKMVGEVSTGFIHFSGHGELNDPGSGAPVFAIRLSDQSLDPTTWRALTFAPHDKGNPFYFFNACDSGQAASLGGFVQGWGPAVLASGASGFIGGMWPLTDRTAAAFSTGFYAGISEHLSEGPVYVADVLRDVRKQFYETGDPTFLAYTFYGNANLQVVPQ